jgi:hypothetical protein
MCVIVLTREKLSTLCITRQTALSGETGRQSFPKGGV